MTLNRNTLQLDNYIIDNTHTSYKGKNIIEKNLIHNILYNNSFPIQPWRIPKPKENHTRNSQIEITPTPNKNGLHLPILARKPIISLKYLITQI
jgi:hypothetical protein